MAAGLTALLGETSTEALAACSEMNLPPRGKPPKSCPGTSSSLSFNPSMGKSASTVSSPEGDLPGGEDTQQELPRYVLQEGAGDSQVVAWGELTVQVDLTVICVTCGASHRGCR